MYHKNARLYGPNEFRAALSAELVLLEKYIDSMDNRDEDLDKATERLQTAREKLNEQNANVSSLIANYYGVRLNRMVQDFNARADNFIADHFPSPEEARNCVKYELRTSWKNNEVTCNTTGELLLRIDFPVEHTVITIPLWNFKFQPDGSDFPSQSGVAETFEEYLQWMDEWAYTQFLTVFAARDHHRS